jgi:hypothetical protein
MFIQPTDLPLVAWFVLAGPSTICEWQPDLTRRSKSGLVGSEEGSGT